MSTIFDFIEDGYRFVAEEIPGNKADARITISKDGAVVQAGLWPAYKVWNIAAHARDIVADLGRGLAVAGSDGLGGGVTLRDDDRDRPHAWDGGTCVACGCRDTAPAATEPCPEHDAQAPECGARVGEDVERWLRGGSP